MYKIDMRNVDIKNADVYEQSRSVRDVIFVHVNEKGKQERVDGLHG